MLISPQDLSDNCLEPAGALAIAEMVDSNSTLTHLSLRGTYLERVYYILSHALHRECITFCLMMSIESVLHSVSCSP